MDSRYELPKLNARSRSNKRSGPNLKTLNKPIQDQTLLRTSDLGLFRKHGQQLQSGSRNSTITKDLGLALALLQRQARELAPPFPLQQLGHSQAD
jgi:hypothetical protein